MENNTIIVVGVVEKDGYGNLLVTPAGGGEKVKIAAKRSNLHPLFQQGRAVMLDWQTYMNKPYVAGATLVEGKLPPPIKPTMLPDDAEKLAKALAEANPPKELAKHDPSGQETGMWYKHKAFALSYAKDLACHGAIEVKALFIYAEEMLDWLNKPMV